MGTIRLILFLAWRNILRYRRRTIQTFLILFCGAFCVMVIDAYMKGFASSSMDRIVGQAGHLDVHAAGYLDSAEATPLDLAIADAEPLMETMLAAASRAASPGVIPLAAASVATGCMLSNGETSVGAGVLAAEPFARTPPAGASVPNPQFAGARDAVVSGHFFLNPGERGALLDEKYARKLGLSVGDPLILLGNDAYGSFSMMESTVIGLAREASLPGEAGCVVDLASFAPAFGLDGMATGISLWFASDGGAKLAACDAEADAARAVIAALNAEGGRELPPVARAFAEISASYAAMFDFLDVFLAGMMAIFALVACVGMANAILLSVQERVKDLGTLRAIALTSRQAGYLIYAETLMTALAASLCSLGVGALAIAALEAAGFGFGFDLSDVAASLPSAIRPAFLMGRILAISLLSVVFPIAAAVLPAHAARGLTIRESLGV